MEKRGLEYNVPPDYVSKMHYWGIFECPVGTIQFWCNNYTIEGILTTLHEILINTSAGHRKSFLNMFTQVYYEKMDVIGYPLMVVPFTPPGRKEGGE